MDMKDMWLILILTQGNFIKNALYITNMYVFNELYI